MSSKIKVFLVSVALATVWLIGHVNGQAPVKKPVNGLAYYSRTEATLACVFANKFYAKDLLERFHNRKLYQCIADAWKYQKEIDEATGGKDKSLKLANEALWILGFKSTKGSTAEDYFKFALKLNPNNGGNYAPEIHDTKTPEHKAFMDFVAEALKVDRFKHLKKKPAK